MKQRREGGSVPGFIVVAIVLIGLLVGGAYIVQQQGKNKPPAAPVTVDQPKEEQKPTEQLTPTPQTSDSTPQSPRELPQGGPRETIVTVAMMGILVGVVVSFLQSRRRLAPL